jgi:hypothetical protein
MGVFDRLANVGKGWVATKRNQARDVDLVAAAEEKLSQARQALGKVGRDDPALDEEEARLRQATTRPVVRPTSAKIDSNFKATTGPAPQEDRPLAPETDADGNIKKRL